MQRVHNQHLKPLVFHFFSLISREGLFLCTSETHTYIHSSLFCSQNPVMSKKWERNNYSLLFIVALPFHGYLFSSGSHSFSSILTLYFSLFHITFLMVFSGNGGLWQGTLFSIWAAVVVMNNDFKGRNRSSVVKDGCQADGEDYEFGACNVILALKFLSVLY